MIRQTLMTSSRVNLYAEARGSLVVSVDWFVIVAAFTWFLPRASACVYDDVTQYGN